MASPTSLSGITEVNPMSKPLVQWPINPRRTAVIVVDMQKVFCEPR
ncbi:hypothetical protein ALQ72_00192 [Pseudomonas syringae pv. maculicola]|uniref:Isochorismatase protein n=1 Tax=Pseudomonas syringae pv. maculicola TaxID=59511 RepID=A0A0N0G2A7_PSEYM|nr:Isochorismatase family protein [Pseudomonas syringae pv. maculicola]RMM82504.1 hypothetical protein ALQ72_00192 [Pseudomonas syringae pv. maculicola]RMV38526.1 hypothetical protein ALP13_01012 [Pseudomonas syringae pv. maculicola]